MADIIQLFPKTERSDQLFQAIWGKLGEPAILAKDGSDEDKSEVITASAMALGRALAVVCKGDREAIELMMPTVIEALKQFADEGADIIGVVDGICGE